MYGSNVTSGTAGGRKAGAAETEADQLQIPTARQTDNATAKHFFTHLIMYDLQGEEKIFCNAKVSVSASVLKHFLSSVHQQRGWCRKNQFTFHCIIPPEKCGLSCTTIRNAPVATGVNRTTFYPLIVSPHGKNHVDYHMKSATMQKTSSGSTRSKSFRRRCIQESLPQGTGNCLLRPKKNTLC